MLQIFTNKTLICDFLYNKKSMNNEKNKNILYINHKVELLIWLIILLVIIGFCSILYIYKEKNDNNDYNIFMPDVDGLIVGSPVRAMGIEVGHVVKIKPTNDEVFVKFIITDKDVIIPQGTKATVEFSGMAGSKSLELYLPDKTSYLDSSTPLLEVNPPKRLHDVASLFNDMFKRIGNMIYTSSRFGKEIRNMDLPSTNNNMNLNEFIKYSDDMLDEATERANKFGRKLNYVNRKK